MNASDTKQQSGTDWARVEAMTDEEIDTSDIPPLDETFFANAKLRHKLLEAIVKSVLGEMGRPDCNVPIVTPGGPILEELDGISRMIPMWRVVFSCSVAGASNNRTKVAFEIATPPERSEADITAEVRQRLRQKLAEQ